MARLLEADGLQLLREHGFPTPNWKLASTRAEIASALGEIGLPAVIKAHVPVNRRAKSGGVLFIDQRDNGVSAGESLLGAEIGRFEVGEVLVAERVEIEHELYVAITYDQDAWPMLLVSAEGGIDVEEQGKTVRLTIDPLTGLRDYQARRAWLEADLSREFLSQASHLAERLWTLLTNAHATTVEINPLAITPTSEFSACAAVIAIDEESPHPIRRRAVSERQFRAETKLEREAREADEGDPYRGTARYTELEGDIGLICGGGGASLAVMDLLFAHGLRPANYCEVGGNPSAEKVEALTRVVLRKPLRALLVCQNVTNNTRLDQMALGVTAALNELPANTRPPVVIRQAGLYEHEGRLIYERAGLEWHGRDWTFEDAVRAVGEIVSRGAG